MYYSTTYLSPLGKITLACDACGKNLVGLWLEGQKYYQGTLKEALIEKDAVPLFDIAKKWLDRYFSGQKPDVAELPLAPQGNAFRQGVWEILCTIPYGEVITYGSIAAYKEITHIINIRTIFCIRLHNYFPSTAKSIEVIDLTAAEESL